MNIKHLEKVFILVFLVGILIIPTSVSADTKAGITPSSPFYFLDTTFEKIGLIFTFGSERKAEKALEYAEERLAEAEVLAKESNPEAVEKVISNYEKNISFATEKSKSIKDDIKAKELLNKISESTIKHQQTLIIFLDKVPEEAKDSIIKAIEVSKHGQEKALELIGKLEEEVSELKKEIEELKDEQNIDQKSEIDLLREEIEELKRNQSESKVIERIVEVTVPAKAVEAPSKTTRKEDGSQLSITDVSPNQILNSVANVVTIKGKGFKKGFTINIGDKDMTYLSVLVNSETITVRVTTDIASGIYDVVVENTDEENYTSKNALTIQSPPTKKEKETLSSEEIFNKVAPATVFILTNTASGSGVIFESNGYILTNAHVVEGYNSVTVALNEKGYIRKPYKEYTASVIGRDEINDLAVIKINGSNFPVVSFGNSNEDSLKFTHKVRAFGYPLSPIIGFDTVKVLSGEIVGRVSDDYLQIDANIQPGNSGGPLVDKNALLVGINTVCLSGAGSIFCEQGFGFAIPINKIKPLISSLKSGSQTLKPGYTPPPTTSSSPTPSPTPTVPTQTTPGALTISISPSPAPQNIIAGVQAFAFADYRFDASPSGEDVRFSSIPLKLTLSKVTATDITACQLFDGSTSLNTGSNVVNPTGTNHVFTLDQALTIPKGTIKTLVLKCNVSSGVSDTGTISWGISATPSITVTGVSSGSSVAETVIASTGSTMTVATSNFTVSLDSSSPSYKIASGGTTSNVISVIRFTGTNEAINLQRVALQLTEGSASDIKQLTILDGSMVLGSAIFTGTNTIATSTFTSRFTVPKNGSRILTVRADLAKIGTGETGTAGQLIKIDWDNDATIGTRGVGQESGQTIDRTSSSDTSSGGIRMFKSYPTVTKITVPTNTLSNGEKILLRWKVNADSAGDIGLHKFTFKIATATAKVSSLNLHAYTDSSFSNPISGFRSDGGILTDNLNLGTVWSSSASQIEIRSQASIQVPAGATRYFEIRGTVSNSSAGASVSTQLEGDGAYANISTANNIDNNSNDDFIWSDQSSASHSLNSSDWTNGYGVSGLPSSNLSTEVLSN